MTPSLRAVLTELDRAGSHIVYDTHAKRANLKNGHPTADALEVSREDLLALFENAWITRFDALDGEYRYCITELGRKAGRE